MVHIYTDLQNDLRNSENLTLSEIRSIFPNPKHLSLSYGAWFLFVNRQSSSFLISWGGARLSQLGTSVTNWAIVAAPDDGAYAGIKIGRGNPCTRRRPAPVQLCPPHIQFARHWD